MPAAWVITFERSLFHCLEFVSLLRDSKVSLLGVLCCYSRLLLAEFVSWFRFGSRSDSFLDDWHVKLVRFAWAQAAICISCRQIISSCLMLWIFARSLLGLSCLQDHSKRFSVFKRVLSLRGSVGTASTWSVSTVEFQAHHLFHPFGCFGFRARRRGDSAAGRTSFKTRSDWRPLCLTTFILNSLEKTRKRDTRNAGAWGTMSCRPLAAMNFWLLWHVVSIRKRAFWS